MKAERIKGTYARTYRKHVLAATGMRSLFVVVMNGRMVRGLRSLHRTLSGRKLSKMNRLRFHR